MYKYEEHKMGEVPFVEEQLFYSGDTSQIYRDGDYLYKIYTKNEPFRRQKLDYLLERQDALRKVSIPPVRKLKIGDSYGMKMSYLSGEDFYHFVCNRQDMDLFLRILKELSSRLKTINLMDIHFSDLHHHNILLDGEEPYYIDVDDASIGEYGSGHISCISRNLHELEYKSYQYEDDLIKYGNLDRESLGIFLLDYLLGFSIEKRSYDEFQRIVSSLEPFIDGALLDSLSRLKNKEESLRTVYKDYVGDYLTSSNVEGLKRYQKVRL